MSEPASSPCILVFSRVPELGQVKTRLAAVAGDAAALLLHQAFVLDLMDALSGLGLPVIVAATPGDRLQEMRHWLGSDQRLLAQQGDDLGTRMARAFSDCFALGYDRVLGIGSDLPDLDSTTIAEGLTALNNTAAVLGPAQDGGYYAIGFRAGTFTPSVFFDMTWSRPDVFVVTWNRLQEAGLDVHVLPQRSDVDVLDDLKALVARNHGQDTRSLRVARQVLEGREIDLGGEKKRGRRSPAGPVNET